MSNGAFRLSLDRVGGIEAMAGLVRCHFYTDVDILSLTKPSQLNK